MTTATAIWVVLRDHLPQGEWIPLEDVYAIVEKNISFDAEDLSHRPAGAVRPRWKATVRTLLRSKTQAGVLRSRRGG